MDQPSLNLSSRAKEQLARRGGRDLWSYGLAGTNNQEFKFSAEQCGSVCSRVSVRGAALVVSARNDAVTLTSFF